MTNITAAHDLGQLFGPAFPIVIISVGLCAVYPLFHPLPKLWSLLAMLPQQMILTIGASTAITAMFYGHFPDGVIRSHSFLVADQAPAVFAAVFHTLAILANVWKLPWRT